MKVLCTWVGNVTNSVWIQYYTVAPSPWYELMAIRNQNWINGMFWVVILRFAQQKKSKYKHLEFLRSHTLWPFPRKESINRAFCQNTLWHECNVVFFKNGGQKFDSAVVSKTFNTYFLSTVFGGKSPFLCDKDVWQKQLVETASYNSTLEGKNPFTFLNFNFFDCNRFKNNYFSLIHLSSCYRTVPPTTFKVVV